MQQYGTDWAATYNSDIERASLVVECLRHPKNEVGDLHVTVGRCLARISGKKRSKRNCSVADPLKFSKNTIEWYIL
ncbi:hypothetical protein RchiOBHm_Chr2g0120681 [Rosa chinensis]|uniref:Uncharacterized protein n=1 Tax=Rosa chinensis TaxID=74649 RepID=A0A2P6RSB8_ROSCH|nr:hypothetical protein RchiOBHm_Chr2g0120681 [Rosa chinensis]